MIKGISILFFLSYLFSDKHHPHNCNQNFINLLSSNEPFLELKKEKCYTSDYIESIPVIDGILDEEVWEDFSQSNIQGYAHSFIQEEPQNMEDPSFRTLVKILHDNNNIYIAAKLFDSNPDSINRVLSRKDDWERAFSDQSDWFSIEFDSKHDHQSGYMFSVNASGIQLDAMTFLDSDYDLEYNAVWESKVSIDKEGWNIEISIPFKMLNITQVENPWGINIHRYIYRYNEYSSWIVFERGTPGISSQFGHIFGFKEFKVKRFIEIKPYALLGINKINNLLLEDDQLYKDSFNRIKSNSYHNNPFGLDAKFRLSSASFINLTINPDFGQIEMDPEYINLSYYEIYLPEKRTFFNESVAIFETPIEIFYSRRIGASSDSIENNVDYALKFIGSTDSGWNLGSIVARTSESNQSKNYFANRVSKDILNGNSIVGLSGTNLIDGSNTYSALSFDNIYYLHNNLILDYQFVRSINNKIYGSAQNLNLEYDSSFPIMFSYDMEIYDKNFNINKVGYNERNNLKSHKLTIGYKNTQPNLNLFRRYRWDITLSYADNFDGLNLNSGIALITKYYTNRYNKFSLGYIIENEHYDDYYMYDYELALNGPAFLIPKTNRVFAKFNSDTKKQISFDFGLASSTSINNDKLLESDLNIHCTFGDSHVLNMGFQKISFNSMFDFLESVEDDQYENVNHYIFSNTTGWNNRYAISFEKYFNQKISLKVYSEYFIHYNKFGGYREWQGGGLIESEFINGVIDVDGNFQLLPLYTEGSVEPETSIVDGEIETEQYLNPNYYVGFYPRYSSINFNLSFKWEYNSNSDFYIVLRVSKSVNGKTFNNINDFLMYTDSNDWTEKYFNNSIYIKLNHWFDI